MITKQNSLNFMVFLYSFDFYFKLRWLNMISLFLNSDIFDEIYYLHFFECSLEHDALKYSAISQHFCDQFP